MRAGKIIPLRFNEAQVRLYATYKWFREHRLPVRIVICKARRAGLSTGVESIIYDDTTTNPLTYSLIVANERNPAQNIIEMTRRFWQHTPEVIRMGDHEIKVRPDIPSIYKNNPPKDRLEFEEPLGSKILIATARSIDAYLGYGFRNIHATEASRYKNAQELFRALYPTLSSGEHSALFIESTPNGQTGEGYWFFRQCMDAHSRRQTEYGDMKLVFIPWHEMVMSFSVPFASDAKRDSFKRSLDKTEQELLQRFSVSMEQLQWRRMILRGPTFNSDEEMFLQEYPEDLATAFLVSGVSVFRRKDIRRMLAETRPPIWEGDIYWGDSDEEAKLSSIHELVRRPRFLTRGEARAEGRKPNVYERDCFDNLKVWRWPEKGERLFICCDVGGGNPETKDGDFSTIGVGVMNEDGRNEGRDEVIMTWTGHLNPIAFAEVASALSWALRYRVGENGVAPELVPEWTGPGKSMVTYIDGKNLYPKLFRHMAIGKHKSPATSHLGWESNHTTVPAAMGFMTRMVEQNLISVPDEDVVLEMSNYRQTDSFNDEGSYGGAAGRHDDHVAWLRIMCFLLRQRRSVGSNDGGWQDAGEDAFRDTTTGDWDPWQSSGLPPMPGMEYRDLDDDDGWDEHLYYQVDD